MYSTLFFTLRNETWSGIFAGGGHLSVGKWLIMVGLEEAKEPKAKGTPPPGALQSGDADGSGGKGSHKVAVKMESGLGGGGGGKLVKWEDMPSELAANGVPKPKLGRPAKACPKVRCN